MLLDQVLKQELFEEEPTEYVSRIYQDEILKACIVRNTIVYLPTGAGKTYIAIMALKHFAKDLEKPTGEGRKWSVFLTATKELAKQQAKKIQMATPLKVAVYTGDLNVDNWEDDRWRNEFGKCQVIVATAQIVRDVVELGCMKISDINLIVFDECHHTRKSHPMLMLMRKFEKVPENDQPRVIGLTGVLTSASIKPKNVLDDLDFLEGALRGTITTAKGAAFNDVLMYSTCPEESVVAYDTSVLTEFQEFITEKVDSMIESIKNWPLDNEDGMNDDDIKAKLQEKCIKICNAFLVQLTNLGLYGGIMANLATIVDLDLMIREASTSSIKWMVRALITSFEEMLHILMEEVGEQALIPEDSTSSPILENDPEIIRTNSSQHVQKLLDSLKQFVEEDPDQPIKGLIFVRERNTARILCSVVRDFFQAYPELNVNVDFMVGQNSNMSDPVETLIGNKNNNKVLEKFKTGEINLIIATNVLEEGIDLQECNLVICYDEPLHFRAYVQMKGRARMRNSQYVIMTNDQNKLQKNLIEWREVSEILQQHLTDIAIDRKPPEQDRIDRATEQKYNESFSTDDGLAIVDYHSAIPLVYRYCSSLPKDMFTVLAPDWTYTQHEKISLTIKNGFSASLLLPIQSPLKEKMTGKTLPSLKLAKKSVAFETIMELYRLGELSKNLLPIDQKNCLNLHKDVYFKSWNQFENDKPKEAGTKKHHRLHDIQVPAALIDSMPRVNIQLYLYEIQMNPVSDTFNMSDKNIKVFHKLLGESSRSYGILTAKPLPRMASMKFSQSFCKIACSVSYEPRLITLGNPEKLAELKRFHYIFFRYILGIWKEFFGYDHKDSFMIVPTNDSQIDWNIVEQFQTWSECKPKSASERENVVYKEEDWLNTVVCPWYTPHHENMRFVVTHVPPDMTPYSPFPDETYKNFADYSEKKYGQRIDRIVEPSQFLLGVKQTTSNLNCIIRGDGEKNTRIGNDVHLIPELCHNFRFPGDLWLKAIIIPSVLHRIPSILHAEHWR